MLFPCHVSCCVTRFLISCSCVVSDLFVCLFCVLPCPSRSHTLTFSPAGVLNPARSAPVQLPALVSLPPNGDLRGVRHSPDLIFYRKTCVRHGWLHGARKNHFLRGAFFFLNFEKGNWKFGNLLSVAQLWHGCSTAAVWDPKI